MTRERIEDMREVVLPFVRKRLLETNYENLGKSDAEEFARDFNEVLNLAIEALKQESKWIPVSENLPKEGGDYLVTLCFDICVKGTVKEVRRNFFCILSKKWLYDDENVIAWMPSPKPYEPQERSGEE